jgi:hypothetical protein
LVIVGVTADVALFAVEAALVVVVDGLERARRFSVDHRVLVDGLAHSGTRGLEVETAQRLLCVKAEA